ncbi:MAG: hypothetical protein HY017_26975 [Betaproteobacteria bacterium]|nr:hypothetical protein [Betaproteobacteria bacterium]
MEIAARLRLPLLLLRIGVFVVRLVWTLDKFIRPEHAASVFKKYFLVAGMSSTVSYALGAIELLLIAAFVAGLRRRVTYGAVLVLHAISTLASYQQYINPYETNTLLFFAAWPMLAACYALYALRDLDTLWSADGKSTGIGRTSAGKTPV